MKIPNSNNLLEKELKSNKKKYIDEVYRCIVENVKKEEALGEKKPEVSKVKKQTSDKKPEVENKLKK